MGAFGDFDGVAQGTVWKTDRFGRVVSRYARTVPKDAVSHIPTSLGNAGGGLLRWLHVQHGSRGPGCGEG